MIVCKECGCNFENDKSLHAHLKKHKLKTKSYYEKHFSKFCLFSGKKILWKDGDNLQSYLSRDFSDKNSMFQYFDTINEDTKTKKSLLLKYLKESFDKNNRLPTQVELDSLPLSPNFLIYEKYYDLPSLLLENNYKNNFNYKINYKDRLPLQKVDIEDFTINIDTREQQSYRFFSEVRGKIDSGDYCLAGKLFNNIVIERKSVSDFGGTVVSGNERFRRELDRTRESNKYLIVLVEFNIHDLYKHKFYGYSNPAFVSHQMRGLIRDYSDCVQFVFGINRELCVRYVVEFLLCGERCRTIDLQLYVDSTHSQWNKEEFSKEDFFELYK
jgi:hypothetical protein